MGSLFDDLKQGLEEAIEYEKGQGKARVNIYDNASERIFKYRNS